MFLTDKLILLRLIIRGGLDEIEAKTKHQNQYGTKKKI